MAKGSTNYSHSTRTSQKLELANLLSALGIGLILSSDVDFRLNSELNNLTTIEAFACGCALGLVFKILFGIKENEEVLRKLSRFTLFLSIFTAFVSCFMHLQNISLDGILFSLIAVRASTWLVTRGVRGKISKPALSGISKVELYNFMGITVGLFLPIALRSLLPSELSSSWILESKDGNSPLSISLTFAIVLDAVLQFFSYMEDKKEKIEFIKKTQDTSPKSEKEISIKYSRTNYLLIVSLPVLITLIIQALIFSIARIDGGTKIFCKESVLFTFYFGVMLATYVNSFVDEPEPKQEERPNNLISRLANDFVSKFPIQKHYVPALAGAILVSMLLHTKVLEKILLSISIITLHITLLVTAYFYESYCVWTIDKIRRAFDNKGTISVVYLSLAMTLSIHLMLFSYWDSNTTFLLFSTTSYLVLFLASLKLNRKIGFI